MSDKALFLVTKQVAFLRCESPRIGTLQGQTTQEAELSSEWKDSRTTILSCADVARMVSGKRRGSLCFALSLRCDRDRCGSDHQQQTQVGRRDGELIHRCYRPPYRCRNYRWSRTTIVKYRSAVPYSPTITRANHKHRIEEIGCWACHGAP